VQPNVTIIQQYISGGNLHELLREKEQPIPLAQRLGIALGAHFAVLSQCTVAHWVVGGAELWFGGRHSGGDALLALAGAPADPSRP
jgi:hypothetical protein